MDGAALMARDQREGVAIEEDDGADETFGGERHSVEVKTQEPISRAHLVPDRDQRLETGAAQGDRVDADMDQELQPARVTQHDGMARGV